MKSRYFVLAAMIAAASAMAEVQIDTYPCWDGNVTDMWAGVAQSFVPPTSNTILRNFTFALDPTDAQRTVTFEIYQWSNDTGPVGGPLYSAAAPWPVAGGDVSIDNIDLVLTEGVLYGAVVYLGGFDGSSVHFMYNNTCYPDGDASWYSVLGEWYYLSSSWNLQFRAVFSGAVANGFANWGELKVLYR
jgi:hypothetical protein